MKLTMKYDNILEGKCLILLITTRINGVTIIKANKEILSERTEGK